MFPWQQLQIISCRDDIPGLLKRVLDLACREQRGSSGILYELARYVAIIVPSGEPRTR